MSRYYRIVVSKNPDPIPGLPAGVDKPVTWTNLVNGRADLGAQTIEVDVNLQAFDSSVGSGWLRIWGPTKEQISEASNFNGSRIQVYVGMQKGLPLANYAVDHSQAGLIISGTVFQCFGNWQGINQTLEFTILWDGGATQAQPGNIVVNWKQGQKMSEALQSTLSAAYPKSKINIDISDQLVLPQDETATFQTVQQLSQYVKGVSLDILGQNNDSYSGVSIILHDGSFSVRDNKASAPGKTTNITVQDLVGSPTWLNPFQVSFNTVMRADLQIQDKVKFPPIASVTAQTNPNSGSNVRNKNTFSGDWIITYVRHVGNSRSPDAQSWITNFQAISDQAPGNLTTPGNTSA